MKPVQTKHTTLILGAPKDWDSKRYGDCMGLPVARGSGTVCSYWKASWRERLAILLGRPVRLVVAGNTTPPVWLDTEEV